MADEKHVALLKQGVEVWNAWRQKTPDIRPGATHKAVKVLSSHSFVGRDRTPQRRATKPPG